MQVLYVKDIHPTLLHIWIVCNRSLQKACWWDIIRYMNPDLLQATLVIRVRHDIRHDKGKKAHYWQIEPSTRNSLWTNIASIILTTKWRNPLELIIATLGNFAILKKKHLCWDPREIILKYWDPILGRCVGTSQTDYSLTSKVYSLNTKDPKWFTAEYNFCVVAVTHWLHRLAHNYQVLLLETCAGHQRLHNSS
jgi:hypothetical protein